MKNLTITALLLTVIGSTAQAQSNIIDSAGGGLFLSRYVASVVPATTPLIPAMEEVQVTAVQTREADELLLEISSDLESALNASMELELNAE
jgi:hypothetical protein